MFNVWSGLICIWYFLTWILKILDNLSITRFTKSQVQFHVKFGLLVGKITYLCPFFSWSLIVTLPQAVPIQLTSPISLIWFISQIRKSHTPLNIVLYITIVIRDPKKLYGPFQLWVDYFFLQYCQLRLSKTFYALVDSTIFSWNWNILIRMKINLTLFPSI